MPIGTRLGMVRRQFLEQDGDDKWHVGAGEQWQRGLRFEDVVQLPRQSLDWPDADVPAVTIWLAINL